MGDPDFTKREPLPLVEMPPPPAAAAGFPRGAELRTFRLGACSVILTRELGRWHLSIAHPSRYPSWDEIAEARYRILPRDVWMALHLPPRKEYVNLHKNCFQLVQVDPLPDGI